MYAVDVSYIHFVHSYIFIFLFDVKQMYVFPKSFYSALKCKIFNSSESLCILFCFVYTCIDMLDFDIGTVLEDIFTLYSALGCDISILI